MTYSVYNIKIDNEIIFPSGITAGYVLGINANGTTDWVQKQISNSRSRYNAGFTAFTSTVGLMAGLAFTFSTISSGKVMIVGNWCGVGSTNASLHTHGLRYATGSAPANAAALTGTIATTASFTWNSSTAPGVGLTVVLEGLSNNVTYWYDLGCSASAGTTRARDINFTWVEIP